MQRRQEAKMQSEDIPCKGAKMQRRIFWIHAKVLKGKDAKKNILGSRKGAKRQRCKE
jgi:hypothetical protein